MVRAALVAVVLLAGCGGDDPAAVEPGRYACLLGNVLTVRDDQSWQMALPSGAVLFKTGDVNTDGHTPLTSHDAADLCGLR